MTEVMLYNSGPLTGMEIVAFITVFTTIVWALWALLHDDDEDDGYGA